MNEQIVKLKMNEQIVKLKISYQQCSEFTIILI